MKGCIFPPSKDPKVKINICKLKVLDIDTMKECFHAEFKLEYTWNLTREDLYQYIIQPEGWVPSWCPSAPVMPNSRTTDSVNARPGKFRVQRNGELVEVLQDWLVIGTFVEVMELENFPFDYQPLHINLQFQTEGKNITWIVDQKPLDVPGDGKTGFFLSNGAVVLPKKTVDEQTAPVQSQDAHVGIRVVARRMKRIYIYRILVVQSVINALTLSVFTLEAVEERADRLAIVFVTLLVAVAYSQIAANMLPVLGYLTLIDKYILQSLMFIAAIAAQVMFVNDPDTDALCLLVDRSFLLLWHLASIAYVCLVIYPKEKSKKFSETDSDLLDILETNPAPPTDTVDSDWAISPLSKCGFGLGAKSPI